MKKILFIILYILIGLYTKAITHNIAIGQQYIEKTVSNGDIVLFQKEVMSCLRKRNLVRNIESFTNNVPYELSFYGYFSKKYRNKWDMLGNFLDTEIVNQKQELNNDGNQRPQIDELLL